MSNPETTGWVVAFLGCCLRAQVATYAGADLRATAWAAAGLIVFFAAPAP